MTFLDLGLILFNIRFATFACASNALRVLHPCNTLTLETGGHLASTVSRSARGACGGGNTCSACTACRASSACRVPAARGAFGACCACSRPWVHRVAVVSVAPVEGVVTDENTND